MIIPVDLCVAFIIMLQVIASTMHTYVVCEFSI